MKLHRNLIEASIITLDDIFNQGKYADKAIEKTLMLNPKWGARDRGFIAESTYEIVRYWRLYLAGVNKTEAPTLPDLWDVFASHLIHKGIELPNWTEFSEIKLEEVQLNLHKAYSNRSVAESIPDWMHELGMAQLPDKWQNELHSMNMPAQVVLRVNILKTSVEALAKALAAEDIETIKRKEYPDALILKKRQNVFKTEMFKNGLFEVQDAGSQLIAPYLDVQPGMRVVDACAGAGGKSLHLASLMDNKGKIIAMDVENWKLENLKKRARRAGISNIEPKLIESSKTIKRLHDSVDRVLLDVPCSGLGVLKRNPDTKWKLSPDFIEEVKKTQATILESYSKMLKVGGKVVYSTCSIFPEENEKQVEKFLVKYPNFKLIKSHQEYPSETGFDGFYMALLERTE